MLTTSTTRSLEYALLSELSSILKEDSHLRIHDEDKGARKRISIICGLGRSALYTEFSIDFAKGPSEAICELADRMRSCALAMCEFPERFVTRAA